MSRTPTFKTSHRRLSGGASEFRRLLTGRSYTLPGSVGTSPRGAAGDLFRLIKPEANREFARLMDKNYRIRPKGTGAVAAAAKLRGSAAVEAARRAALRKLVKDAVWAGVTGGAKLNPAVNAALTFLTEVWGMFGAPAAASYMAPGPIVNPDGTVTHFGIRSELIDDGVFPTWPAGSISQFTGSDAWPTWTQAKSWVNEIYHFGERTRVAPLHLVYWPSWALPPNPLVNGRQRVRWMPQRKPGRGIMRQLRAEARAGAMYRPLTEPVRIKPPPNKGTFQTFKGRPPPYVKERKLKVSGQVYAAMRFAADAMGEAYEWIDLLAAAAGWTYKREIGGSRVYNKAMWLFFHNGVEHIDWDAFNDLRLYNEVEDFAYGSFGKGMAGAADALGTTIGFEFSPLW